jgi:anti-sigma B factor antagonist
MKMTIHKINDFSVLNIDGRIDSSNFSFFEEEINQLLDKGVKNIIFNCSGLKYISSSGLRIFLVTQKKTISLKGKLHLCNMQPAIKEIFDISGFSNIFMIFDTLGEALTV